MISLRSLVSMSLVTLSAGALAGCKEDTPAKPEPASSVAGLASHKGKLSLRNPIAPGAKVDPQTMKEYRADVCYFGSLTLRQARDAYLASLGKDEPSAKKIPSFGGPPAPPTAPGGSAAVVASAAAKPKASGAPRASAGPAGPAGMPETGRRPFDMAVRAPHERNARACTAAAALKDPPMPAVDDAISQFAPFAVDVAKNIAAAQNYYQREEYKKDNFAKGQELHKKLLEDFKKLDELSGKVGDAIAAWRKEHPVALDKLEEGQKVAVTAFEDARALMVAVVEKKVEPAAYKEGLAKIEKSVEALKTFGTGHATDPWAKIMTPALDGFVKSAKDADAKIDKGIDPDAYLGLITSFTSVVEAKHRALTRSLISKGQTADPANPAATAAPDSEHK
jgi:hypothetical protein